MDSVIRVVAGVPYFERDPRSRLPVLFDWSAWLARESTTIVASEWTVHGVTIDSPAFGTTSASVYVSGGTAGVTSTLRNTITCANGLIESRSLKVVTKDR